MDYELDETRIIKEIKEKNHELILLQLADGLKPEAENLVKKIESETQAQCLLWLGTCFGACDLPENTPHLGISLIINFGHNAYIKDVEKW